MASPLDIVRSVLQSAKLGFQLNNPLLTPGTLAKTGAAIRNVGQKITEAGVVRPQQESLPAHALRSSASPLLTFAGGTIGGIGRAAELAGQPRQTAQTFSQAPLFSFESLGNYDKPSKASLILDVGLPTADVSDFARYGVMGLVAGSVVEAGSKNISKTKNATPILDDIGKSFESARKASNQIRKATTGTFGQQVRTQLLDRLTPIYDLVKLTPKEISASNNPYKQMRLLAGISGKTEAIINQNLAPILQKNADNLDDLSALLVLEREGELTARGFQRARNLEQINQGLQELEQKYGTMGFTQLRQSADEIRQFGYRLLDSLFDAGIIDEQSFKTIRQNNQFYVPFEIVENIADKLEKSDFARASFNVASQDVIKAIGSTTKDVADPLEALLRKTAKVTTLVEKNKALQKLVDLRNVAPEIFGNLIRPVSGEAGKGFGIINLFENGKNVRYAVPEVVERAIKGLDAETSNILVKVLSPQAKLLRAGATGLNIGFIPANIIRDISDAILTEASEKGVRGVAALLSSYPQALFSAARKGDLYNQWLMAGGAQSTLTEQVFKRGPKALQEVAGNRSIIKRILSSPKDLIEFANRVGEQSTRIARFQAGLKRGEDVAEAAFKSRDITLDFAKAGNTIKVLNQVIPFLNAGIQGSEKLARLYKNNPKAAIAYSTLLYGVPSVMLYQHNSQFEDFRDIPEAERQVYWIIMARDRTPEERANGDKIAGVKIPKGFLGRAVAGITDSSLDFMRDRDPQAFATFLADTAESISPVGLPTDTASLGRTLSTILPPGIQAGVEVATNKNLFFDQPIVPQSMEGVEPAEQYKESTSGAAKAIGQATGISPLVLENTVSTMTGGLGRQFLQGISGNLGEATAGQITRRFSGIRSGKETDKEFDEVAKFATKSKTESLQRKREAEKILEEYEQMPKEDLRVVLARLKRTDPALYKKVIDTAEEKKLGLNSLDRYIKSLGVEDGTRAEYIASRLKDAQPGAEREALLRDFRRKKILTNSVIKQLALLKKEGKF